MHVVVFEGSNWQSFAPLSLSRPVFTLACGIGTLLDKQIRATRPDRLTLWVRPQLVEYCRHEVLPTLPCPTTINTPLDDEPAVLLSGRSLHVSHYQLPEQESVIVDDGLPGKSWMREAYVRSPGLSLEDALQRTDRWLRLLELPAGQQQARLAGFLWDLIQWNEEAIVTDSTTLPPPPAIPAGPYHIIEPSHVWVGQRATLEPGCVLDGSKGPVIIGDEVTVGANAVLQGPCYVGPRSQVMPLALIRPGTSVGPICRVGGEITRSILLGYTNKSHSGFLGDSYVGSWCNFGAGCSTSNLKNTYGTIRMPADNSTVDTGRRFLGSIIGDHCKLAINTTLMTGSYVGFGSMVATPDYPPAMVPSLTFLTAAGPQPYRTDPLVRTMQAVFARRNRAWTADDDALLQYIAEVSPPIEAVSP